MAEMLYIDVETNPVPIGTYGTRTATFKNKDGVLFDPPIVRCTLTLPDKTHITYEYLVDAEITKLSTGLYEIGIYFDIDGSWIRTWRGYSGSTIVAAAADIITVVLPSQADY